jgi:hypothetical protein
VSREGRAAWALAGVSALLGALHTWLFFGWDTARQDPAGWPLLPAGMVLLAVLGAVIVGRHPRHRVGWLFSVFALCVAVGGPLAVTTTLLHTGEWSAPYAVQVVLLWAYMLMDLPAPVTALTLMFLLFPDGRLLSRRWRVAAWAPVVSFAAAAVLIVSAVRPSHGASEELVRDASAHLDAAYVVVALTFVVESILAAVAVFLRLRRARGEERQQLRWLAAAAAFVVVGFVIALFVPDTGSDLGRWLRVLPLHVATVCVPVAAGLAILRYRLYDIDVVLNRAIVLATLTAAVALGYVGVVVTIGEVVGAQADGRFWPALLATAVVAFASQPLRRRLLRLADRLVYGVRAAPYVALAEFSRSLESSATTEEWLPQVAEAVGRAVRAARASVVLEVPGRPALGATWPVEARPVADDDVVFVVKDRDERLGHIGLRTGQPLSPASVRLVEDLARQVALAMRNARLEAELSSRVDQLAQRTEELEASRRRLVAARDGERERLAQELQRTVIPHLARMPADLAALSATVGTAPAAAVAALADHGRAATAALEQLRLLSRGLVPDDAVPQQRQL